MSELKTLNAIKKERDIVKKLRNIPDEKRTLKTLKDLENNEWRQEIDEPFGWLDVDELKAEAIKWVKAERYCALCEEDFKDFFNITKDDLKECANK